MISSVTKLPFIGNSALNDIYWMLILVPLWWVLGIEQFIYPVILTLAVFKILAETKAIHADKIILFYALFLIVYVFSAFFIVSSTRILTFVRNFATHYSAFLLLIIFYNQKLSTKSIEKIIKAIIIVMAFAGIVGIFGILNIYRGEFTSLMGYILPSFIKNTTYGGAIAYRSTGVTQWFILFGEYFRVSSIFIFSTFFASTLAITLPIFWYKTKAIKNNSKRAILYFLMIVLLLNLFFTTGRVAIGSLMFGSGLIYLFHQEYEKKIKRVLFAGLFVFSICMIVFVFYWEETWLIFESILYARGGGSASSRLGVYKATVSGFFERPVFGWGTEQDIVGLKYPAGSHSNYLGFLYKQGIIGFALMCLIYIYSWVKISSNYHINSILRRSLKGVFGIIVLNGMTDVLDLDATTFLIAWLLLGIGIYGGFNRKIIFKNHDQ